VGAVAVDRDSLLLVERGRPPDVGRWSLPGGRVRPGEPLVAAVEREMLEETGLIVECGDLVGWAERISEDHHFVIFDFHVEVKGGVAVAGDDAAAVRWVRLSAVRDLELVGGLREFLSDHQVVPG
jgi:8-oxo-dGTP diphosphatase